MGSGLLEYSANPTQSQMHTAWKIGSGKGINKDATYNLYVFFQKYIYTGGQWQETDTIESAVYQFRSAKLTPTGTPGATVHMVPAARQVLIRMQP